MVTLSVRWSLAGVMQVALLGSLMHAAGYRAVSFEHNRHCSMCTEYTFVRMQCPELADGLKWYQA
jgi:hypothetical protein